MAVAWLLTALALAGVIAGVLVGQARTLSCYLTAAGGGLLLGISLFWLVPESAAVTGWGPAFVMCAATSLILALVDRAFIHSGRAAFAPILAATAIHSFLDGWSVRTLSTERLTGLAATLGLALHKIPEGAAVGWIARRHLKSTARAAVAAVSVELVTVIGAYVEPHTSQSGFAAFGLGWSSAVFSIIGGSFLFLGIHAILPNWRRLDVLLVFLLTLLLVGTVGLIQTGKV